MSRRGALLLAGLLAAVPAAAGAEDATDWRTPAEIADYRATPSYEETLAFVRRLAAASPAVQLQFFGDSASGRPMPLVVVSREGAFTPEAAGASAKPVVMVQNGIHSGEIDGKDACLALLRDLVTGREPDLLEAATLLIVPIYNVDGHERVSPYNRPNQDGPELGMGHRTTADGHDLNRDYLKLSTPEARHLVALFNRWKPHLVVDVHVTDGVDLDWVLTWATAEAPLLAAPVDRWMKTHWPPVLAAVEFAGVRQGPYVDLRDGLDPTQGFSSVVAEPRFSTGYFPLRHRPTVLIETHSHKPYRERVLAVRELLGALLRQVAAGGAALRAAIASAGLATAMAGQAQAAPSEVAIRYAEAEPEPYLVPFYAWRKEPSLISGGEVLRYRRGEIRAVQVPWYHRLEVELSRPRPRGYLVLPGWPEIERRLADHGLRFERLDRARELEVETARLADPQPAGSSYQGLTRITAETTYQMERRSVPAGALWIPAAQPDFAVAVQLLEPEAPDSLLAWGLVSSIFEGKEYIGEATLDELARQQLVDPAVAAAWQSALADPKFAGDRRARYRWWYRRTPYWDEQVGLYPVFRLMGPLPR